MSQLSTQKLQIYFLLRLPVKAWHTYLDDPTLADAILDRVVHSSHRIDLKGATLRDKKKDQ